jgi:hypothetical protein
MSLVCDLLGRSTGGNVLYRSPFTREVALVLAEDIRMVALCCTVDIFGKGFGRLGLRTVFTMWSYSPSMAISLPRVTALITPHLHKQKLHETLGT